MLVKTNRGVALLLALIASAVVLVIGASFGILVTNEIVQTGKMQDSEKALLLAEAGISDVLYQRLKYPETACFPFNNGLTMEDGSTVSDPTIPAGKMETTFPGADGLSQIHCPYEWSTTFTIGSWPNIQKVRQPQIYHPYAEELLPPNFATLPFGGFDGNHGNAPSGACGAERDCPDVYTPIGRWPEDGYIDFKTGRQIPPNNTSSKERYTTGMFISCNDNLSSAQMNECNNNEQLRDPNFTCVRFCPYMSIVSTGEVLKKRGQKVRRSVKLDVFIPTASAMIEKYVDLTYAKYMDINAPVHINRWKLGYPHPWSDEIDPNKWWAFMYSLQAMWDGLEDILGSGFDFEWLDLVWQLPSAIGNLINPPPVISLSEEYQDNELCFEVPIVGELCINTTVIHIPERLPLPVPLWEKWDDRLKEMEEEAESANVLPLRKLHYDGYPDYTGSQNDEEEDPEGMLDLHCPANAAPRRIHNCFRGDDYTQWGGGGELFDLFKPDGTPDPSCYNYYIGGAECKIDTATKKVNNSLPMSQEKQTNCLFDLTPGIGDLLKQCFLNCAAFAIACNCDPNDNYGGGLCEKCGQVFCKERPLFKFMGKHRVSEGSKVYIDGTTLLGMRTPIHTCYQGAEDILCVSFDFLDMHIEFGFPHWHTGNFQVSGELLSIGKLHLADKIDVYGGTIYAKENIVKDQSSGIDVYLNAKAILCAIIRYFTGFDPCNPDLCGIPIICDILEAFIQPIFDLLWMMLEDLLKAIFGIDIDLERIPLTNNKVIDFAKVPLMARGDPTNPTRNAGTIYTQKTFIYAPPDTEFLVALLNQLLDWLGAGIFEFVPAADPFVLDNGGALIAKEDIIFAGGHPRVDLGIQKPGGDSIGIGFAIAGRDMKIRGDIGQIECEDINDEASCN